ncbi:PP2C family protein-serine/threonine phosphatase [Streptacidiphilus rugosus]|uniref:PP2C family protein-serine/threonine phosphatase n=1 Tax=Streptacidiphilus rugosus TaxID=405783 RepID=UPI00068E39FF|nr:PP2C family protein-serine/threonine phosphatase [Streptacidiphilus rugosus]
MGVVPAPSSRLTAHLGEVPTPPRWVRALPFALVAVGLALQATPANYFAIGFLFIALPAFAAFSSRPRVIWPMAVVSLALQVLVALPEGHAAEQHHLMAYAVTGMVAVVSAALARQRRRQFRDLVAARSVAEALQHTLLRPVPERVGELRTAALYRPAEDGTPISGDLYDLAMTPFGCRALVGDVRGKGLTAVETVSAVLSAFREAAHECGDLAEVAARMDRRLLREAALTGDGELFATAILVQYDPDGGLTVVNRGHLDPLLVADGAVRKLRTPAALPLGFGDLGDPGDPGDLGDAAVPGAGPGAPGGAEAGAAIRHRLRPEEVVLLYTDGASEARDTEGRFYPLRSRLAERFPAGAPECSPAKVVAFLGDDLAAYSERRQDDLALMAISR